MRKVQPLITWVNRFKSMVCADKVVMIDHIINDGMYKYSKIRMT